MKSKNITLWVVLGILAVVAVWGFSSYNSLVGQEENVDKTWDNVQNQYQRRSDLIPNLVATVKGYSEHESSTLESVTAARAGLLEAKESADGVEDPQGNIAAFQKAQSKLQSAMGIYINAVREAYPDLPLWPVLRKRFLLRLMRLLRVRLRWSSDVVLMSF